jgi:hypothetical protein
LNEPELLKLYGKLLAEGRIKPDRNADMYAFWSSQVAKGNAPTPRAVADACETTIHAARSAVRRHTAGVVPKQTSPGLAPKTVRNIHAMIQRALVDAVGWKYITDNPASNVKPSKRPRTRRQVWRPAARGAAGSADVASGTARARRLRIVARRRSAPSGFRTPDPLITESPFATKPIVARLTLCNKRFGRWMPPAATQGAMIKTCG